MHSICISWCIVYSAVQDINKVYVKSFSTAAMHSKLRHCCRQLVLRVDRRGQVHATPGTSDHQRRRAPQGRVRHVNELNSFEDRRWDADYTSGCAQPILRRLWS
jgi:hypothetical protein